jgi:HTH-type transcriptional regulator / antitoxin HigA
MSISHEFQPDWASSPGETIADILRERQVSEAELARRMGVVSGCVSDLVEGRTTITIGVARQLERFLGASVEFWMSRDFQYRQDVARLNQANRDWLAEIPIGDMIRFGWLRPVPRPTEEVTACLQFFSVPSVPAWRAAYAALKETVAFRTSPKFDSRPAAVAAWLRQGEIEAESLKCRPWNIEKFRDSLSELRSLTRKKDPSRFLPEIREHCAESGVAVVVVRAPNGCRASGATRFLSHEKALLQLSFRYLSDDHFWFTFFHEAGHLVLHGENGFFVEGVDTMPAKEETEANEFAADILIPSRLQEEFMQLRATTHDVIRFAVKIGISPGIVVGQLQHHRRIGANQLNGLKRRFQWA